MITPYSTPLKTEYKPLGLEAFAQPLSQMSEKLETAKSLAANVDFEMSRLNQDDPRSKELMELLEKKRNEIATNLSTSKNYRQATQQIADLNKMFNKDPELSSIKSNYEGYKKMEAEHKARVEKGDISQRDFDTWKIKTLGEFKGTGYNQGDKDYTAISLQPRMRNMEEDMRKESLELARMAVLQHAETPGNETVNIDGSTTKLKTTIDYRDLNQVAGEIQRMLATSDKYKDWVQEDADYNFYANSQGPKGQEFQNGVLEGTVSILQNQLAYTKDPKAIATLKAEMAQKTAEIAEAQATGNTKKLAERYYKEAASNKFGQLGMAASDLVDLYSVKTEEQTTAASPDYTAKVKKLDEITPLTVSTSTATIKPGVSITGGATSDADDEIKYKFKQDTYEEMNNLTPDKIPGLKQFTATGLDGKMLEVGSAASRSVLNTGKDLFIVSRRLKDSEKELKDLNAQITLQQIAVSKAPTPEDKKLEIDKLNALTQDKTQTDIALDNEGKTLFNIIERDVQADPDIKKIWEVEAGKDLPKFLDILFKDNVNYLNTKNNTEFEELIFTSEKDKQTVDANTAKYAQDRLVERQKDYSTHVNEAGIDISDMPEEEAASIIAKAKEDYRRQIVEGGHKTSINVFAETIMNNYRANLSSDLASGTTPLEITMDKSLSTITGGTSDILSKWMLDNQGGKSRIDRVTFDSFTGNTTALPENNNFDLSNYVAEGGEKWAGNNQDGIPIIRYTLKRESQPGVESSKSYIATQVRAQKGYTETQPVNDAEVAAWRAANPVDIYVIATGLTSAANPAVAAEKTFVDYASMAIGTQNGEKLFQAVNNFAQVSLIGTPNTRKEYSEFAARLEDARTNNYTTTELTQAPAAFQQNLGPNGQPDGTYSGFTITYSVQNGEHIADISKVTVMGAGKPDVYELVGRKTLSATENLPTQLRSLDIMFGTGAESDLVHSTVGWDTQTFVPAFQNIAGAMQSVGIVPAGK
jgi:hypothetical protein